MSRICLLSLMFSFVLVLHAPGLAAAERIVSINQCADELLLNIVPHERLKSVTHFVKDPQVSWDAEQARGIPGNSGRAEEVLSYGPDVVFAGNFSARSTVSLLRSVGVKVVELDHPESIEDVLRLIRVVGSETGYLAQAERLIQELAVPGPAEMPVIVAAVYQPNGFTTGKQSLIDDVLTIAGVTNVAARRGLASYAHYPMELLIADVPDLLILDPQVHSGPSLAHEMLKHPALRTVYRDSLRVEIPPQAWACGTHHVFAAIELIRTAAMRIGASNG
ncbi:MAG: ABC transporter substrate-binding protein [Pseudomonadales bacterium]|nr:ABC transporter substrate-binding protein [Pseudomonadales bacterium]